MDKRIEWETSAFNADYALAGGVLLAKDSADNLHTVTQFRRNKSDGLYIYSANVDGITITFDEFGISKDERYDLLCASSEIAEQGSKTGDIFTRGDIEEGTQEQIILTSLNYRENVALSVIGAIIGHISDPLAYSDGRIKQIVEMSFKFSYEFANQALKLRQANLSETEDGEENPTEAKDVVVIDDTSLTTNTDKILYNISQHIKTAVNNKNLYREQDKGTHDAERTEDKAFRETVKTAEDSMQMATRKFYADIVKAVTNIDTGADVSGIESQLRTVRSSLGSIESDVAEINTKVSQQSGEGA